MPRELKPCGTPAAARRHRRNKEPLCEAGEQAVRDEKYARDQGKRAEQVEAFHESMPTVPEFTAPDSIDPLAEALDSLQLIRAALRSDQTMPRDIATLTKRRDDLVDRIKRLEDEANDSPEVSVFDELTRKREERKGRAAAAN